MVFIYGLLMLLAGLGIFLYGIHNVGQGMENIVGKNLRIYVTKFSNSTLKNCGVGCLSTMLLQSSSVFTISLVALINIGMISFYQALSLIVGANIGSTLILVLFCFESFKIVEIFAITTLIGSLIITFGRNNKIIKIGKTIAGFGMLFCGLKMMSLGMGDITSIASVNSFITNLQNPWLLILIGIILGINFHTLGTCALVIAMVGLGSDASLGLSLTSASIIVLSAMFGSTAVPILSTINSNIHAKRACAYHVYYNFTSSMLMLLIIFFTNWTNFLMGMFNNASIVIIVTLIFANVFNAIIQIPLLKLADSTLKKLIKNKNQIDNKIDNIFEIDENLLNNFDIVSHQILIGMDKLMELNNSLVIETCQGVFCLKSKDKGKLNKKAKIVKGYVSDTTNNILRITNHLSTNDLHRLHAYNSVLSELTYIIDYCIKINDYVDKEDIIRIDILESENNCYQEAINILKEICDLTSKLFKEEIVNSITANELYGEKLFEFDEKFTKVKINAKKILYSKIKSIKEFETRDKIFFAFNRIDEIFDHMTNLIIKSV